MNSITTNISMPKGLYAQAKVQAKKYHYCSVSELIRDALRWWMNDNLTRNGFTPQFESAVLRREKSMNKFDTVEWDGKTPFTEFVLSHPPTKHVKSRVRRQISKRSKTVSSKTARISRRNQFASSVV